MNMLPNRKTLPEAAAAQLQAIDAIVRAKLGQPQQSNQPTPPKPAAPSADQIKGAQSGNVHKSSSGIQFTVE